MQPSKMAALTENVESENPSKSPLICMICHNEDDKDSQGDVAVTSMSTLTVKRKFHLHFEIKYDMVQCYVLNSPLNQLLYRVSGPVSTSLTCDFLVMQDMSIILWISLVEVIKFRTKALSVDGEKDN